MVDRDQTVIPDVPLVDSKGLVLVIITYEPPEAADRFAVETWRVPAAVVPVEGDEIILRSDMTLRVAHRIWDYRYQRVNVFCSAKAEDHPELELDS